MDSLSHSSSSSSSVIIDSILHMLAKDKYVNPQQHSITRDTIPVFCAKVPIQQDSDSCGYFALRNLIGLIRGEKTFFPFKVRDFINQTMATKMEFKALRKHLIFKLKEIEPIDYFEKRQIFKYTANIVTDQLKNEVKSLFARLKKIHSRFIEHSNELANHGGDIAYLKNSIRKIVLEQCTEIEVPLPGGYESQELERKCQIIKEFKHYYKKNPTTRDLLKTDCFCPSYDENKQKEQDQHNFPNISYTCKRTGKHNRGFKLSTDQTKIRVRTDGDNIQTYLDRIANGCQLNHSPMVPNSGDCGFLLISFFVLLKTSQLIIKQK